MITLQSEMIAKTFFYVSEMGFSKKMIPKQFFHVILRMTNEYVQRKSREMNSGKNFLCNRHVVFREINSQNKNVCM